ncbi:MAG: hypothetical protein AAF721_32735 [Myxococcota bacterium]
MRLAGTEAIDQEPNILVVDDEPEVHEDFRRCLAPRGRSHPNLDALRRSLFCVDAPAPPVPRVFQLEYALTGKEAADLARERLRQERSFALAFVDMRLIGDWNGVQTIRALWSVDARMEMVLCTAYSDFAWGRVSADVGSTGNLHLLRKPFEPERVRRYADALCKKWQLAKRRRR